MGGRGGRGGSSSNVMLGLPAAPEVPAAPLLPPPPLLAKAGILLAVADRKSDSLSPAFVGAVGGAEGDGLMWGRKGFGPSLSSEVGGITLVDMVGQTEDPFRWMTLLPGRFIRFCHSVRSRIILVVRSSPAPPADDEVDVGEVGEANEEDDEGVGLAPW